MARRPTSILIALAAGLALADASIVVLALPQLIGELGTTVEGVAAVIVVYTAVLAATVPLAGRLAEGRPALVGSAGMAVFALASLGCGLSDALAPLLVLRAVQAVGGAGALAGAFSRLGAPDAPARGRLWMLAAVVGAAAGPALGGLLTQAFDWRAIFLVQVPVALAGAAGFAEWRVRHVSAPGPEPAGERTPVRPAVALALLSAALAAVLFLVVLVVVAGWSVEPLAGGAALTILPAAALLTLRTGGDARTRASAGAVLIAGGVAALAGMGSASVWWTVLPLAVAGAGMGLALPALTRDLLPERTVRQATRVLSIRHIGIALCLVLLAPIVASRLEDEIHQGREREVALLLDARLDPRDKLDLVPVLLGGVDERDPRGDLARSFDKAIASAKPGNRAAIRDIHHGSDTVLTDAVANAFRPAFLITAALALAAALLLFPGPRGWARLAMAAGFAATVAAGTALLGDAVREEPVAIQDPCHAHRDLPGTGGIAGTAQDLALRGLDFAACRLGSSREELVLALASDEDAKRYQKEHGVNPRKVLAPVLAVVRRAGELDPGGVIDDLRSRLPQLP